MCVFISNLYLGHILVHVLQCLPYIKSSTERVGYFQKQTRKDRLTSRQESKGKKDSILISCNKKVTNQKSIDA